jgi:cysteine peptidase A
MFYVCILSLLGSVFSRNLLTCYSTTLNKVVDWTNIYTSSVKNTGLCLNAGWAFAATDQIESDVLRLYGTNYKYILSTQQLLDCVSYNSGCYGGRIEYAYNYLLNNGLEQSNNYPLSFFSLSRKCLQEPNLAVAKLNGYYNVLSNNEACMAYYVQTTGPITVCLSTSINWYAYSGGIMSLASCPPTSNINHCLQVVGVYPNINGGYWKLKNSVGTMWGEKGYIRLAYGSNVCNIVNNPIYTLPHVDL